MSDIVEQLRASVTQCRAIDRSALLTAAADEIERLRLAIRRLAEQDATMSVCGGAVTVTLDATLTDAEREAIEQAIGWIGSPNVEDEAMPEDYLPITDTLRCLLKRTKASS
jgi:hypothetical protein